MKHGISPTTPRGRRRGRLIFNNGTALRRIDSRGEIYYVPDQRVLERIRLKRERLTKENAT